ncbi:MAG TPA: HWE histidine kinase domain-containing protein [Beijerinckiaceae bacterium]|jgi:two-component sensor histidine kinase
MASQTTSEQRWFRLLLVALTVAGLLATAGLVRREARQASALEQLRLDQAIDSHAAELQAHLNSREIYAGTVAALFSPGEPIRPHALGTFGQRFLKLSPDVTAIAWLPSVKKEQVSDVLKAIQASGVGEPLIFGQNRRPLAVEAQSSAVSVILDVEPREGNATLIGGSPSDWPERRAVIELVLGSGKVLAVGPLRLFQDPAAVAYILYAPVYAEGGAPIGVLSFAYRADVLLRGPGGSLAKPHPFTFYAYDLSQPEGRSLLFAEGADGGRAAPVPFADISRRTDVVYRQTAIGEVPLILAYAPSDDPNRIGWQRAGVMGGLGLLATAIIVATVGFLASNAMRLAAEVAARRSAEERLHILIQELNHRVRNVLTVAQSIISRSLRPGLGLDEMKSTVTGRYQALSHAMALLTESDWQGADLAEIVALELEPHPNRVSVSGGALLLKSRAAQTMTLLIHELVTNSAKHGALSASAGQVEIAWLVEPVADGATGPDFVFTWIEKGGPPVQAPKRQGFGTQIIERVAPSDLNGQAIVDFAPSGLQFTLRAPLGELVSEQG